MLLRVVPLIRRRLLPATGVVFCLLGVVVAVKGVMVFESSRALQRPPRGEPQLPLELSKKYALEPVRYGVGGEVEIAGWYVPSRSGAAILFVHGQPGTREDLVPEAEAIVDAGYGALLIDLPGHGESTGKATWGETAREAVVQGLDYLVRRCDVAPDKLGVYGFSYGSSLVAQVAAHERRIRALVLAGTFTSARDQIEYAYGSFGPLSIWPAVWGAEWNGLVLDDLHPRDMISEVAPTPILLVAGSSDIVVPEWMTREVFEHARQPKTYLAVEGAAHGNYGDVMGPRYFERLVEFFDKHLAAGLPAKGAGRSADCLAPPSAAPAEK